MVQKEPIKNRAYVIVFPIDVDDYVKFEKLAEVPGLHNSQLLTNYDDITIFWYIFLGKIIILCDPITPVQSS